MTVTARDPFNNTATGYLGTIHFTKSDNGAGSRCRPDYTFVAGDNGVHTFINGVTLVTIGAQTLTATDTQTSRISGTATVNVTAAGANHLSFAGPVHQFCRADDCAVHPGAGPHRGQ